MKVALRVIFWFNIFLFVVAFALYLTGSAMFTKVIGAATLFMAAVLIPFFLFYRYDLKRRLKEEQEEMIAETEE